MQPAQGMGQLRLCGGERLRRRLFGVGRLAGIDPQVVERTQAGDRGAGVVLLVELALQPVEGIALDVGEAHRVAVQRGDVAGHRLAPACLRLRQAEATRQLLPFAEQATERTGRVGVAVGVRFERGAHPGQRVVEYRPPVGGRAVARLGGEGLAECLCELQELPPLVEQPAGHLATRRRSIAPAGQRRGRVAGRVGGGVTAEPRLPGPLLVLQPLPGHRFVGGGRVTHGALL
jgi:hypothetical protein